MNIDPKDLEILNQLQENSKLTNKQLSMKLNLSVTAVFERVKKLERSGIIKTYAAILDRKELGRELMVYSHVKLEKHSQKNISEFENQIKLLDEVHECYHVSGDYDYILKMTFSDMDEYREFMVKKLTTIPSIGSTHSIFVISEVKSEVGYKL
ncbi:MAG: Lrp/AsnC family transcriptional regulator [Flavobacteriaceae bacterium]|jgi:Lrp/AsnC family leucine-responsive transcriptional regulator|nr:Lrp/AsnC family transcriptional regulator [Flavobacteriaceae bacterium]